MGRDSPYSNNPLSETPRWRGSVRRVDMPSPWPRAQSYQLAGEALSHLLVRRSMRYTYSFFEAFAGISMLTTRADRDFLFYFYSIVSDHCLSSIPVLPVPGDICLLEAQSGKRRTLMTWRCCSRHSFENDGWLSAILELFSNVRKFLTLNMILDPIHCRGLVWGESCSPLSPATGVGL